MSGNPSDPFISEASPRDFVDWTERYRPTSVAHLVGNGTALKALQTWAQSWTQGPPAQRAVILAGPPGVGKTSAAIALANDMGWSVIELNASDARNADSIRRIATAGAMHQTLAFDGSYHRATEQDGRKLIVLDEADNLTESLRGENAAGGKGDKDLSDKGGKKQIVETIKQTQQPIILIVNDLYALQKGSGSTLGKLALTLKFQRVQARTIVPALRRIATAEGVAVDPAVLEAVAQKAGGDLRAAVRDLETLCSGRKEVGPQHLADLGQRDNTTNMFDAMKQILRAKRMSEIRRVTMATEGTPEDLILWMDENMPKEYLDPQDLVNGYEMLSRADVFLGRARSTMNFGLWSYASELSTQGVWAVKQNTYTHWGKYGFPQWLSKMSRSRGARGLKNDLAEIIGRYTHCSKAKARNEMIEPIMALCRADEEFAEDIAYELDLSDAQIGVLLDEKTTAKRVKDMVARIKERQEAAKALGLEQAKHTALSSSGLGGFATEPEDDEEEEPVITEPVIQDDEDVEADVEETPAPRKDPEPKPGQQKLF